MNDSHEYGCEYAKSDRSMCKLCKSNIGLGQVRLARYVQSPFFDGKVPNWYHLRCFFNKCLPHDPVQIRGFDNLRYFLLYFIKFQNLAK
jgi:hypothetical protein